MIELEELEKISKIKNLSIKSAEKDYLLEIVLYIISKYAGRKLAFKGGTALYKLYSLNRFSEDLDFTLIDFKLDLNKLLKNIIDSLKDININAKVKEVDEYHNQKNIKLELKGPLYKGNVNELSVISINLSLKERIVLDVESEKIFPYYKEIVSFDVFVVNLNEIFAEKIRAILTRDKARDVYDLWFLLKKNVKFDLSVVNKKLKIYAKKYNKEELINKIEEKNKMWNLDLKNLMLGEIPNFQNVKKEILKFLIQKP